METNSLGISETSLSEAVAEPTLGISENSLSKAVAEPTPASEEDSGLDLARIFTFKHLNNEVISGNILDIQATCRGMAGVAIEHAFAMAEALEAGQRLNENKEEPKEEDEADEKGEQEAKNDAKETKETAEVKSKADITKEEKPAAELKPSQEDPTPQTAQAEPVKPVPAKAIKSQSPELKTDSQAQNEGSSTATKTPEMAPAQQKPVSANESPAPTEQPASQAETGGSTSAVWDAAAEKPVAEPALKPTAAHRPAAEAVAQTATRAEPGAAFEIADAGPAEPESKKSVPDGAEAQIDSDEIIVNVRPEDNSFEDLANIAEVQEESLTQDLDELVLSGLSVEADVGDADDDNLAAGEEFYPLSAASDEIGGSPAELVENEVYEVQAGDGFIIPAEAQSFDMTEFAPGSSELTAELSVPIEVVEDSIKLVINAIEGLEPQESETVHEILDEIVQIIAEAQTPAKDDTHSLEAAVETAVETIDAKEDLKELFIELFDYLEIEYSMELIESFVKLALQGDMSDLIEAIKQDEEKSAAQDRGTHEVIKQLLASVQKMKTALAHAYNLGKSAMRLCFFEFSIAPGSIIT